jgi:hypothetical protein
MGEIMKSLLIGTLNFTVETGMLLVLTVGGILAYSAFVGLGEFGHPNPLMGMAIIIGSIVFGTMLFGFLALALRIEQHLRAISESMKFSATSRDKRKERIEPSAGPASFSN